ncbi:hypothetical protein [Planctomyces sp. SH-PL62]|uniref:hypothetical protein n=1 Tax=Planctomyces sp. SH-PL62 TaxID=1636152 RepID=UPI0012E7100A|nr:hypothetical protein [Planctomyces sp. SH-PL62]
MTVRAARKRCGLRYRLLPDNANAHGEDTLSFLAGLRRRLKGPMTILWDRSNNHQRCGLVKKYLAKHPEIVTEEFPGYAPEPTRTRGYGAGRSTIRCPTSPRRAWGSCGLDWRVNCRH